MQNFDEWCELDDEVGCTLVLKNVKNPNSITIGPIKEIEVSLFLNNYEVHRQQENVTPILIPMELSITD